ncbi:MULTISPECIES: ABC transporter substrate-binding protein [unclassified Paludibacterium]|uniref:substrate-binding periplasmic protein n=1 Tax=unclassified Paludibacterium TaxID=2618429 RepID=UPI001C03AAAE|nr:transporter substrate-binding domain-containing protein [Paludibacterium sp. B53371]BEV71382.1 hypothetical protein THUN1379_08640 [Paludibacterium sp. THUN1379]
MLRYGGFSPASSRRRTSLGFLLLIGMLALARPCLAADRDVIRVCDDNNFAPFLMSINGETHGATAELMRQMFLRLGLRYRITIMPWQRCKAYLKEGSYDMAPDVTYDPARLQDFRLSQAYYQTASTFFYLRSRFPNGMPVRHARELLPYQGCGLFGYSYARYGLPVGKLNTHANSYQELVRMLRSGLCDYFLGEQEIILGNALPGPNQLDINGVIIGKLDDVAPNSLHFLLGRRGPNTDWLLPQLNQQIEHFNQSDTMKHLVDQALSP